MARILIKNNKKCKYFARFHDWIHLHTATITCLENYADRFGMDYDPDAPRTYESIKIMNLTKEKKKMSDIGIANINAWTNNLNGKNWGMHILQYYITWVKSYWDDSLYQFI